MCNHFRPREPSKQLPSIKTQEVLLPCAPDEIWVQHVVSWKVWTSTACQASIEVLKIHVSSFCQNDALISYWFLNYKHLFISWFFRDVLVASFNRLATVVIFCTSVVASGGLGCWGCFKCLQYIRVGLLCGDDIVLRSLTTWPKQWWTRPFLGHVQLAVEIFTDTHQDMDVNVKLE